ncbi:MAG: hypothetical protein AAF927_14550 [Bacteroidota bacterium]
MKLRCTRDSVRIRIRKSELAQLGQVREIGERVSFGPSNELQFALKIEDDIETVKAAFAHGRILISIPSKKAERWFQPQEVGIEAQIALSADRHLHVLIEKDFPCNDREGEDKSDTFWELAPESPDAC